jgi:gluconokinase
VIIGLDVGTSGVKAAAFGIESSFEHVAIREYPLLEPAPGREELDPAQVRGAAATALAEAAGAATGAGGRVIGVSVSTAMHGLMALDAGLAPLTGLVTWADSRAVEQSRALRRTPQLAAHLQALTGAPVHPMTPLCKLQWFAANQPATWQAARWWVGLKEWLLAWLTGRLVTEESSAGGTGLLDMARHDWSDEAIELCGVERDRLAPILPTTSVLALSPPAAARVGLPAGTPVVAGAADGPLANLGSGAIEPGLAEVTLGTSGAVRAAVHGPRVDAGGSLFCYALADPLWVVGGAISNGGSALRWAGGALAPDLAGADGRAPGADVQLLDLAASAPAGCDGLLMLPYLLAERAPLWDPDLPGAYLGLRRRHTRAHLVRAAIEGVCLQMRLVLDRLDAVQQVEVLHASGGAFRSQLVRQVMAASLGRTLRLTGDAEGTARGAAALGLYGVGRAADLPAAIAAVSRFEPAIETVEPDPALVETYRELAASLPGLVGDLAPVARLVGDGAAPAEGGTTPTGATAGGRGNAAGH